MPGGRESEWEGEWIVGMSWRGYALSLQLGACYDDRVAGAVQSVSQRQQGESSSTLAAQSWRVGRLLLASIYPRLWTFGARSSVLCSPDGRRICACSWCPGRCAWNKFQRLTMRPGCSTRFFAPGAGGGGRVERRRRQQQECRAGWTCLDVLMDGCVTELTRAVNRRR